MAKAEMQLPYVWVGGDVVRFYVKSDLTQGDDRDQMRGEAVRGFRDALAEVAQYEANIRATYEAETGNGTPE